MNSPTKIKETRIEEATQVGFFQFLRILQSSQKRRLGGDLKPNAEPVRLRCDAQTAFPTAEVANYTINPEGRPTLDVSFFGLFGASGALPHHYSQLIIDRLRAKDHSLRDFLDLFNHRLLSMFYRAWEKHHFPISHETAAAAGHEDTLTRGLWALIGSRGNATRNRLPTPEGFELFFSGHLSRPRPIPGSLESMLRHIFEVPVQVKGFQGQWMLIAVKEQSQLGTSPLGVSMNNRLGMDSVAGQRIWDVENRFRICIGPLSFKRFSEFTPTGGRLDELTQWVRRYVGPQFDFDVQVSVKNDEVRGVRLGDSSSCNLGWNTWLGEWRNSQAASDAVFSDTML